MNRQSFIIIGIIGVVLALVASAVFSAQDVPPYTDTASPDWSRGQLIGYASLVNPIAMLSDSQGQTHLVWVTGKLPDGQQLQYTHLNAQGEVVESKALALPQPRPETPTLFRGDDGTLRLFYLAQSPQLEPLERALYSARISADGNVLDSKLSAIEETPVKTYSVVVAPDRCQVLRAGDKPQPAYHIYYSDDDATPGIHYLHQGLGYSIAGCAYYLIESTPYVSFGTRPTAQVDTQDQIHLAWFQHPSDADGIHRNQAELYYGIYNTMGVSPLRPFKLVAFEYPAGVDLRPPHIALDRTHVYINWVQDKRGGKGDLNSQLFYVSFPQGQPRTFAEPAQINLLNTGRIQYEPRLFESLTQFAPMPLGPVSNYLKDWQWLTGQHDVAIGVGLVGLKDKQRGAVQIASLVMAQGQPAGYQLINRSLVPANQPSIAMAANRTLQAAWLDSTDGERYAVRFATTEPRLVARWNQLSWRDVTTRSLNLLWYELSFLPYAVLSSVWLVLPLGLLIVKTIWSGEATLDNRGSRITLALALIAHVVVKTLVLPPLPSDWVWWQSGAVIVGLALCGVAMIAWYLRRTRYPSLIIAYLVFALTDIALTLFVYLPIVNA